MIGSHFASSVSEKGDMQKAVSKGWCKESRLFATLYMSPQQRPKSDRADAQSDIWH